MQSFHLHPASGYSMQTVIGRSRGSISMPSRLMRPTILLTVSMMLCLSLPRVQAMPPADASSVYLPMVHAGTELVLSELVTYPSSQYTLTTVGQVSNLSATQAYSVTLRVDASCDVISPPGIS